MLFQRCSCIRPTLVDGEKGLTDLIIRAKCAPIAGSVEPTDARSGYEVRSASTEAARLYFQNYKAGKSQLIDVQTADNRALLSKINKTRIEAQILNQLNQLRAVSGREVQ